MSWDWFYIFVIVSAIFFAGGAAAALFGKSKSSSDTAQWLTLGGMAVLVSFVTAMWISLGRPPMRTMGETRLWYSLFVVVAGLVTYRRWHFRWIMLFTGILATVFNIVNIAKPELHDQSLMPALQSFWFIPHVTIYMFAYGILGCAFVLAVAGLYNSKTDYLPSIDTLVYIGTALMTVGMLMGAVWAKKAWGDYWTWDAKETWAAATWFSYLVYIHLRLAAPKRKKCLYIVVVVSFAMLQMCWYGYRYLPASQSSMHIYNTIIQ